MIPVQFNGESTYIGQGENLLVFLTKMGYQGNTFVVSVNENFIPRTHYQEVVLKERDQIEVLSAMQGG